MAQIKFNNIDVVTMARGTDATFTFQYTKPDGSAFTPSLYTIVAECRLAYSNEQPDFYATVTSADTDTGWVMTIKFDKSNFPSSLREHIVYWRVLATEESTELTSVINFGEIWLQ